MSDKSNNQGRAFEYACLTALHNAIEEQRGAVVDENSSYYAAVKAWNTLDASMQDTLLTSASAAVINLFGLEPLMCEPGDDRLELYIQPDNNGKTGDVRDIIISRRAIAWEIGLSLKHNHYAVKHSRLGRTLDFGKSWFDMPCSNEYWNAVAPIFERLEADNARGTRWREMPDKAQTVYAPLLQIFMDELKRSAAASPKMPRRMVEYMLGKYDYYKVIGIDDERLTRILVFNLHGTLNKAGESVKPKLLVPIASLPTRIVNVDFKPHSTTTIELYMDGGWQFSFRIHNAEEFVVPSLKFDVQLVGMPTSIICINCPWG